MKKFILIISTLFFHCLVNGQEKGKNYQFTNQFTLQEGTEFKAGYRIKVKDTLKNGDVRFIVFKFIGNDKPNQTNISALNTKLFANNNGTIEHVISKKDFEFYTTQIYPIYKGVRAGFYTIPFKIRINDFDFEQNVNFGMNVGLQYRFSRKVENRWIIEPSLGIGLSRININSKNSDLTEERTAGAITFSFGTILHFDQNINIGLFTGLDLLGNNDKDVRWKYDRKPWLGIGVNIGFSVSENKGDGLKNKEKS